MRLQLIDFCPQKTSIDYNQQFCKITTVRKQVALSKFIKVEWQPLGITKIFSKRPVVHRARGLACLYQYTYSAINCSRVSSLSSGSSTHSLS